MTGGLTVTARGIGVVAAAIALLATGFRFGYPDLALLGTAAGLAVLSGGAFAAWRPRLSVDRVADPDRVARGESATMTLTVRNTSRVRAASLVATDRCGRRTVAVPLLRLRPGRDTTVTYPVPTERRGVVPIGPLRVTRGDPLGLLSLARAHGEACTVWVHPRIHPLQAVPAGMARSLDGRIDKVPHGTITFDSLREYVVGDELRRVHWRSSAKVGELMVREQLDTSEPTIVVLLDDRAGAHPRADDGVAETFEAACEAAASVIAAAVGEGLPVSLHLVTGVVTGPFLDVLTEAALRPGEGDPLTATLRRLRQRRLGDTVVFLTGPGGRDDLAAVSALRDAYPVLIAGLFGTRDDGPVAHGAGLIVVEAEDGERFAAAWDGGTGMVRALRAAVVPLVLAALTALPALVLGRIYSGDLLVMLVVGAAAGSVGVGVAARRLPSWTVGPLSVLLMAGYTVAALRLTAQRAEMTGPLGPLAVDALTNGIPRLLTAMIPVEPTPDTVVVPVVATWLAGLAGAEVALRAGRVLLGVLPPVALFAGALYVVGPNAGAAGWPTPVFAALVTVALAVSARPAGRAAAADLPADVPTGTRAALRGRALAGTAMTLAVVLALIALVGPWVGARVAATPVDPRQYVQPPQVDTLDESPLNRISGWSLDPGQRLFELHAGPAPAPTPARTQGGTGGQDQTQRLRLAVLPDYDGVTWRVGATYRNAGRVLPTSPPLPGARVEQVRQEITVDGLTGRLLPAVPTPTGVQGARVAYDPASGTLIHPEGLKPGLRYTVTSAVELPDLNQLTGADVPSGDAVARFLSLGADVPPQLQRLADQLATDNGAPYDRAVAIEEFLAEHYRKVADAPSGHAYPNLTYFLFGPRNSGGQRGTSEQFAAAFAVLARLTGLPTRVVVGFDAPAAGGTVTGKDASAWPEVLFDGLGWVSFDPLPSETAPPRPVEEDFTARPATPPPATATPSSTEASTPAPPTPVLAAPPTAGTPAVVVAGGVSAAVVAVLGVVALALLLLRRGQRRRRLVTGGPQHRIEGAWLEFTDALRLAGRPAPGHLAATEVAAHAATAPPLRRQAPGQAVHLPRVDELVAGVNTGSFAPHDADQAQADRAGRQAVAYADALRAHRPWWRRLLWSVHPGPLRWHRGR